MRAQKSFLANQSYTKGLQLIVYGSVILYFGRNILIPVSFALLVSFVLYPVCSWLESKGMGRGAAIVISITILILSGLLLVALLIAQFLNFVVEWPALQHKLYDSLGELSLLITNAFGMSREEQNGFISRMADQSSGSILQLFKSTISASAFSAVLLVLVPVYSVLILYYRNYWMQIVYRIFPHEERDSLRHIIWMTIKTYYNFIKGMGLVYLAIGILNSVGLLVLGVPHAILFGFMASVLTFIPYIGIIIGSLLPITVAWITYDSVWYPISIIGIFTFVQYLEANIIFPLAVSHRLNVNTLVMLLSIFVGGLLWGMAGMILFVPFVGIAKLIADHNPRWKTVSMILGTDK